MSNRVLVDVQEGVETPKWLNKVEPFVQKVLEHLDLDDWEISFLFCNDEFIHKLNLEYRKIDSATDVLSFEQGDEYVDDNDNTWYTAGDIVISLDTLPKNAENFSVPIGEELKRLIIHGILHLDGMDHTDNSPEQEMLQYQERLLQEYTGEEII